MARPTRIVGSVVLSVLLVGALAVGMAWAADEPAFAAGEGPLGLRGLIRDTLKQIGERLRGLRAELNLTQEQKVEVGKVLKGYRDEIVKTVKGVHEGRDAVRKAVRNERIDERAIRRAVRDLSDTLGDAAVLHAKVRRDIRAVLTDDQRKVADDVAADIDKIIDDAIAKLDK